MHSLISLINVTSSRRTSRARRQETKRGGKEKGKGREGKGPCRWLLCFLFSPRLINREEEKECSQQNNDPNRKKKRQGRELSLISWLKRVPPDKAIGTLRAERETGKRGGRGKRKGMVKSGCRSISYTSTFFTVFSTCAQTGGIEKHRRSRGILR